MQGFCQAQHPAFAVYSQKLGAALKFQSGKERELERVRLLFSEIADHIDYVSMRPDVERVLPAGYVNPAIK